MISRGAAILFMVASLVAVNVLAFKALSKGREQSTEQGVYRYSNSLSRFFLFMTPVVAGWMFIIYSSDSAPPEGIGLIVFGAFAIVTLGFPVFGFAYVARYRVCVDPRGITVTSLFRVRYIPFPDIAAIATMRGRGVDYWLFSAGDKCIAKIGGSVEDFSSLQDDVELGTRSNKVMIYDWETYQGWRARANESNEEWRKSDGPPLIRNRNRRVNIELAVGVVFVAAVVFTLWRMGLLH